jgi:hypothetical protein
MKMASPWTRRSTGAWSAPSSTWWWWGQTYSSVCVCALIFRLPRGLHIGRLSRGLSGTWTTLLSLVFDILPPRHSHFTNTPMLILLGVVWIASLPRVVASFSVLLWFLGRPTSKLV